MMVEICQGEIESCSLFGFIVGSFGISLFQTVYDTYYFILVWMIAQAQLQAVYRRTAS